MQGVEDDMFCMGECFHRFKIRHKCIGIVVKSSKNFIAGKAILVEEIIKNKLRCLNPSLLLVTMASVPTATAFLHEIFVKLNKKASPLW